MAIIHFYRLNYLTKITRINAEGQPEYDKWYHKFDEFEKDFKDIVEKHMQNNCLLLDDKPEWCLLEVLESGKNITTPTVCGIREADYIFARIGRKKDINEIQKRNRNDFTANDIDKTDDEDIEVFTYFYMIFERTEGKVVIVYLTSQSAPNIRRLDNLMFKYSLDKSKTTFITPIITKDVANILQRKDVVNAFSYTISIPSDKILGLEGIGLSEEAYDSLENIKNTEVVVTITAERNKNLFKEKGSIGRFKDKLYQTHGSKVKDILAKAKNKGGGLLPYHFLDNEFIEKATFKCASDDGSQRVQEIKQKLLEKYMDHRRDLLEYMK